MSAASDDGHKAKKQCVVFEPQAWRKTLCRNCFKTKNDHASSGDADADNQQKTPATSPVVDDGDVVILRREGTPMKDGSRGGTPTDSSTTTSPTVTPAGDKTTFVPEQSTLALNGKENDGQTTEGVPSDKKKDKTTSKTCPEVDKNSPSSNMSAATTADKVRAKNEAGNVTVGLSELEKTEKSSTAQVSHKNKDDGKTSKADAEQSDESKPTAAALSQSTEHKSSGSFDIQGSTAASEAPTSASEPIVVGEAVNSSAALELPGVDGADISASATIQHPPTVESSPAESGHRDNASSPQVMERTADDTTVNASSHQDVSSSGNIAGRLDDASTAVVSAAAAGVANSDASDEIIDDAARSAQADRTDGTKIVRGGGERPADSSLGEDAAAAETGASRESNAGLSEDSQRVRQLDRTPERRICSTDVPSVQGGLFTNDDLAETADSGSDATSTSSISLATAVESGGAAVQQQSQGLRVDVGAATGNDFVPEVTSRDGAAGHAKVEATITLSGSSSPYVVDSSRPIHVVSVAGISDYQRGGGGGVWTSAVPQNVQEFVVGAEQSRQPPDYEQSAGYSPSSVRSDRAPLTPDDDYGPTSPLVEYLSRSPFARSLHGATERSPETEIVATGGGGETSLFHHVPAAGDCSDESTRAAGVSNDARDWEADQARNGCAVRLAANSDTDNRCGIITLTRS